MLHITKIRVQNVRVHKAYELSLFPSTTIIIGANGSGKTSLIEALYIALQGSSFKSGDGDIVKTNASWYRIDVWCSDDTRRTVKFDSTRTTGKKKFDIDGHTQYRLLPRFRYPVVLFEPDDLRLLGGSPSRRRIYIDRFISQLNPAYPIALRKYERALKQRNNLLKQPQVRSDELFVWDVGLSEYGAFIMSQRNHFIQLINEQLTAVYGKIAGSDDTVAMRYSATVLTKQKLLSELHANTKKDMLIGSTSVGPHRHDIQFTFNSTPVASVASRGEVRSMLLALKFIEVAILESTLGSKPIILLDDVFSELDAIRQRHLAKNFKDNQVIITSATAQIRGNNVINIES